MINHGQGYYTAHTGFYEWYTPQWIVDKCRAVMGSIDLDPFSCDAANKIVGATQFYDAQRDALIGDWDAVETMFANPPYATTIINQCCNKITEQYMKNKFDLGMVLVNNATDTSWFHELMAFSTHMVIFKKRISFINPLIEKPKPNTRGQILFLINRHDKYPSCQDMYLRLLEQFSSHGQVIRLYDCDCDNNW